MMLSELNKFFLKQNEPEKSCLLFLRRYILEYNDELTEAWKYGMPFYCYKGKMLCYLWVHKKSGLPYIGLVDGIEIQHKDLIRENRARMKILLINPQKDIPVKTIKSILQKAIELRVSRY